MGISVAHPQSGYLFTASRNELEFGNVGFCGGRKTGVPGEKPSEQGRENQQQTQPTYGVNSGYQTQATLVGGECSHHCAIPAPSKIFKTVYYILIHVLII